MTIIIVALIIFHFVAPAQSDDHNHSCTHSRRKIPGLTQLTLLLLLLLLLLVL